ncbi:glycosyltransferase family 2 protein [Methylopila sp. M107]|uniref:glycosyltransferase family 2 protein n=1 Tax=Methylopila sp. M107 TaxID=1101190 RepID=UPI00037739C9|nr:glycosyltransferase family 2 protein [Methylopila sp. M107]
MSGKKISFVIPVYNEEAVLPILIRRLGLLLAKLDAPAEVIFVDDGGKDAGGVYLAELARNDPRYRYIALSRNFGHQVAITAGMEAATGDAVIVMDADLQDPPEVALELVAKWREGYEIVYARRERREGETVFKRWTASAFYRVVAKLSRVEIPRDVGDFRLVDRAALDAFLKMPEQNRFVRGMFAWVGFRQAEVLYRREARAAGVTHYPLRKMLSLAGSAIVSFSDAPLRLALWFGTLVSLGAMGYGAYVLVRALFWSDGLVEGWASTILITSFLSGINLLMTGIVGVYVGRIYSEAKRRPLYLVSRKIGFDAEERVAPVRSVAS